MYEGREELGIDVEVLAAPPTEGDTTVQLETLDGMIVKDLRCYYIFTN